MYIEWALSSSKRYQRQKAPYFEDWKTKDTVLNDEYLVCLAKSSLLTEGLNEGL